MKKALSFALALVLVVSLAAPTALAASPTAPLESATATAPLPVVVPSASDDVTLVATNDVAKLPEGAREVLVEAQNALKDAVPGDLSLVFPHRIMVDIEEMLLALDKVTPGIASEETLLYGV